MRSQHIRARIRTAEGTWPEEKAPLSPQVLGTLERKGYRIEKLIFQTRPGCYATASCYIPTAGSGPFPAVLCVHGHWAGARRDPVVQSRCVGLAKLGFIALTLDAWGAGERGTVVGQNEYHGGLLGATLWPVGTPLHGLQLYDNIRALDYLQARPDVDAQRLGCTGASGGGNQTTYLSAFDERVKCAVPVCSVGTFESYLSAACCVDEVLMGGLTFAEEGDLLGMVAPRALMVITASRDVPHFGPTIAGQALNRARPYFHVHAATEKIRHVVIDSGHAYNQPMREAMYGWMRRWLQGEGDGSPFPEPALQTEDAESLRCFGLPFRSGKVMTTVDWVRSRSRELAEKAARRVTRNSWTTLRDSRLTALRSHLALPSEPGRGRMREGPEVSPYPVDELEVEGGVRIPTAALRGMEPLSNGSAAVVLLHPGGIQAALASPEATELRARGIHTRALELRGCGSLTLPGQALGNTIPDHNLVEWSLWIGRPLLGQWIQDLRQLVSTMESRGVTRVAVLGWREGALAALLAGALDPRLRGAAGIEPLLSYTGGLVPDGLRMAVFSPGLMEVGDIPQLAALAAPRPVLVAAPIRLDGTPASPQETEAAYAWPREVYAALGKEGNLRAQPSTASVLFAQAISDWLR